MLSKPGFCECSDPSCPAHAGYSTCPNKTVIAILYRIDMTDETGTAMCEACTADAMASDIFCSEELV